MIFCICTWQAEWKYYIWVISMVIFYIHDITLTDTCNNELRKLWDIFTFTHKYRQILTHFNHVTSSKRVDTLICHTTICRDSINFLYNPDHMTLWCLEVVPVFYAGVRYWYHNNFYHFITDLTYLEFITTKINWFKCWLWNTEQGLPRPLYEPVNATTVDQWREHATARTEGVSHRTHAQHYVKVVSGEIHAQLNIIIYHHASY